MSSDHQSSNTLRKIFLAGGCFWGVQQYMAGIRGVAATEVGYANGDPSIENPSYEAVRYENTGHTEAVRIDYDPALCPLKALLRLFYEIIDPTEVDRQGHDIGHTYRTGVYYTDQADLPVITETVRELAGKYEKPLAMEVLPLANFWTAEEYHQDYLEKNPTGYCHVPLAKIRWVKTVDPMDFA